MPSDVARRSRRPSPRDRLLKAADELFYAEGVHSVGMDRVIARGRRRARLALQHVRQQDELIRAYLERRMEISTGRLRAAVEAHADPRERSAVRLRRAGRGLRPPRLPGLPVQPGHCRGAAGQRRLTQVRGPTAAGCVTSAGPGRHRRSTRSGPAASQIHLLYDGAMLAASLDGNAGITAASRTAAEALLDAALASRGSGRHRKEPVGAG